MNIGTAPSPSERFMAFDHVYANPNWNPFWNRRFAVATVLAVATGLLLWIELRRQARAVPDPVARRPTERAGP